MRAGRIILAVLLLPIAGCMTQPNETATAQKQTGEKRARSTNLSGLDRQLYVAVSRRDVEGARSALVEGANPNTGWGYDGGTVLHHAIAAGYTGIAELLIAHGADLRARHEAMCDATPLHLAAEFGRGEIAGLLIAYGAELNARDVDGMTPLHKAVWQGNAEMAKLLLTHGADVNAKDKRRDTPLHVAALNGHVQVFDLLVAKGADMKAKNKQGLTPVGYARSMPPQAMTRLTPDGAWPYVVIITSVSEIRGFLRNRATAYDRFWIPGEADVKQAEAILSRPRENGRAVRAGDAPGHEPVVADLSRYNREYAGFMRGKARFMICNLNQYGPGNKPCENRFSGGMDGGCAFMRIVVALDAERVEWVECNGF